jgi:hypothetical protein
MQITILFYQVNFKLIVTLKLIYAFIQTFICYLCLFQAHYVCLFRHETSTSSMSYIVWIISFHLAQILQLFQCDVLIIV